MATAYVTLQSDLRIYPVSYSIGPVIEDVSDLMLGWYRNSFVPQPTGATFTSLASIGIGPGSTDTNSTTSSGSGAHVHNTSGATNIEIAVPDEMQDPPVAPRTLQHGKSFLVFYGSLSAGVAAVRDVNTLTLAAGHGLRNGQLVTVATTNTLPAGLSVDTLYYVRARTATSIELALTAGGSAITLSDAGTGTHTVVPFGKTGWFDMADGPNYTNTEPIT